MFGAPLFGFARPAPSGAPGHLNRPAPRQERFGLCSGGRPPHDTAARVHRLAGLLHEAWRRHRSRECLARMDDKLLKDIGLSYAEAEAEMNKPFWIG